MYHHNINLYVKNPLLQLFDQDTKHSLDRIKSRQKSLNEVRQAYIIDQVATAGMIYAIKKPITSTF